MTVESYRTNLDLDRKLFNKGTDAGFELRFRLLDKKIDVPSFQVHRRHMSKRQWLRLPFYYADSWDGVFMVRNDDETEPRAYQVRDKSLYIDVINFEKPESKRRRL